MKKLLTVAVCFLIFPLTAFGDAVNTANQADYYRTHYAEILDKAAAEAERQHPGDGYFAEMVRHEVLAKMDRAIYAQQLAEKDIAGETETRTDMRLNDLEAQVSQQQHQIDEMKRELDLKVNR